MYNLKVRDATFSTPIVVICFKRADLLRETIKAIELIRPQKVYFVQDWFDADSLHLESDCLEVSELLDSIIWPGEIVRIQSKSNLGLKARIATGLTQVFEDVEKAIIIEDDIQVNVKGFYFLQKMLDEYSLDHTIWQINASNLVRKFDIPRSQYRFSQYAHSWGWGTWADRWSKYDGDLEFWPEYSESVSFRQRFEHRSEMTYWKNIFDDVYFGRNTSSWAYPWLAAMWFHEARAISPNVNYVLNNGFDSRATHTTHAPRQPIDLGSSEGINSNVLIAPESQCINTDADRDEYLFHYGGQFRRLKNSRMGNCLNQIRMKVARFWDSN